LYFQHQGCGCGTERRLGPNAGLMMNRETLSLPYFGNANCFGLRHNYIFNMVVIYLLNMIHDKNIDTFYLPSLL
jgi:hypothetical protein